MLFLEKFPKKARLHTNQQFHRVCKHGRYFQGMAISYKYLISKEQSALGIRVGKKQGNAALRNRFKRLVREAFRKNQKHFINKISCVVYPKAPLEDICFQTILKDLQVFTQKSLCVSEKP